MFGNLTLDAFKHEPLQNAVSFSVLIAGALFIALLFYLKRWKWLWNEWITSLDPKKIGVMYFVVAAIMLFKGVSDALMIRIQQVLSVDASSGFISSNHFQQVFTAHGTTMIFFVGMGLLFCLMNLIIPLQIGARDVAYPFLNALSFWLFATGALLLMVSMIVGAFSAAGWVGYPPLSSLKYSPDTGVDYWIWSVQIAGVGSLLSGINFTVTIFKMRCPGMHFMKLPIFVWNMLGALSLILFAFPVLTITVAMLTLDRFLGMHFFSPDLGGNPMLYINLIWAWGHPEVYILIFPAFGIYSEVVATFSQKRLFGYASMVWAVIAIAFLSFIVWVHHFFTMGAGAHVNAFFGFMTMLIAIPTGVKIFNWLFTMFRGKVQFKTPMLWFLAFIAIFTIGGSEGVLMSLAPVDFQLHNSLFLIAHFHSMLVGGFLFGVFAGLTYWFPKFAGFKLDEKWGRYACFSWVTGFVLAFFPLYVLGLMGATRRLDHYSSATGWRPLFIIAIIGVLFIFCGIGCQVMQFYVSFRNRKKNRDKTGDPWNGRTLEWSTTSPPPEYNYAVIPKVKERDAFWTAKHSKPKKEVVKTFEMPKNSPIPFLLGICCFFLGFGLIWHIHWLSLVAFLGVVICLIIRLSDDETERTIRVRS